MYTYIETQGEIETPHCANISLALRHCHSAIILCIIQSNKINVNIFLKVGFADQQVILPRVKMSYSVPQDPLFPRQWYLVSKPFLPVLLLCNYTIANSSTLDSMEVSTVEMT